MGVRLATFLATGVLCFGCKSSQPHRLSEPQVIKTAQQIGIEHGQELQRYTAPSPYFDPRDQTWYVTFTAKKAYRYEPPWSGGFMVGINDLTGSTNYWEHVYK